MAVPVKQNTWIHADVRLPNINERVLACSIDGIIWIVKTKYVERSNGTTVWVWFTDNGSFLDTKYAPYWRPLPAPPINLKKEDNNDL